MIGDGAVIGLHAANPGRGHTDGRGGAGEHSKSTAAGDWHGAGSGKVEANEGHKALYGAWGQLLKLRRKDLPSVDFKSSKRSILSNVCAGDACDFALVSP